MMINRGKPGERRVVVTGIGMVSAAGHSVEEFWKNVTDGRSSAKGIERFSTTNLPVKFAAEINDFSVSKFSKLPKAARYDRSVQYSLAAATNAFADAGLEDHQFDPLRIGVIEGTTVSAMESILKASHSMASSYKRIHPYNVVGGYFGEGSSAISISLGIQGHSMTYCSGCSSGSDSIGYARQIIADDEADFMLAGGAEAITELLHSGFCKLRTMPEDSTLDPMEAMRPFDTGRDGFLLGEGAAFLVLEELTSALERSRPIYAELVSHGRVSEAFHSTDPHPEGFGYQASMQSALKKAGAPPDSIQYINAHGSATPLNDPIETYAIKSVFKKHSKKLQVSASKPIFGHLMGAAGAMESIVTVLAIAKSEIPQTINLTSPDPRCDLDYVPGESRRYPVEHALCLNAGFGGRYSCLYFRKC